jgi:hypothetical protein
VARSPDDGMVRSVRRAGVPSAALGRLITRLAQCSGVSPERRVVSHRAFPQYASPSQHGHGDKHTIGYR